MQDRSPSPRPFARPLSIPSSIHCCAMVGMIWVPCSFLNDFRTTWLSNRDQYDLVTSGVEAHQGRGTAERTSQRCLATDRLVHLAGCILAPNGRFAKRLPLPLLILRICSDLPTEPGYRASTACTAQGSSATVPSSYERCPTAWRYDTGPEER